MRNNCWMLLTGLAWSQALAAPARQEVPSPRPAARAHPIRVLLVTGGHDFDRDAFLEMFRAFPDISLQEVRQPEALSYFAPDKADRYDVMVWYDMVQAISEQDRKHLIALLERGKPLVGLHHCLANYQDWPEALKILGGRYWLEGRDRRSSSTFREGMDVQVRIANPLHPITRFMKDFDIHDEVYGNLEVLPSVTPILTVDHPQSSKIIGWTHHYGKSRVAYLQLGHGPEAYGNANYRRLVSQAIRWAAGALPDPDESGFVELLRPGSFAGWEMMGDPKGFWWTDQQTLRSESGKGGDWMRTAREYGDFALRVEWKVGEGGNSGVFLRCADKAAGYPWETGSEIQISNEPRDEAHCTGSLYGSAAFNPRPDETGDVWHEFWVEARGPFVQVFADNVPVVDVDARLVPALARRPARGYIGLQDSHNRESYVEFRRVAVKERAPETRPRREAQAEPVWRVGTQAYTFRIFPFFEAIDKAKSLGLKYIESYPGQMFSPDAKNVKWDHNAPPELREKAKVKLKEAGVKLALYGVVGITKDEAATRKIFEFAKDMGIETLTAEPDPAAMDLLDKLTEEFNIKVAIHNHPKNPFTRYWNPQQVLDAIKGHSPRIGACADTGHWVRSGLDPIECLKMLEGHIISLHFKDLSEKSPKAHDVPWGTGVANARGMLEELKRQRFSGVFSVEYEHNWENSLPDITESLKFFRKVAVELGQKVE